MPHVRRSDGRISQELAPATESDYQDQMGGSPRAQYCGLGMSVAWQYYHARKRSEETPLDYLYRLNVAALRAKLKIKDGNPIATSKRDPELADVDDLEEVLRARERAKSIRVKIPTEGPGQRSDSASPGGDGVSGSDGSDSEGDLRRIFLAAAEEKLISAGGASRDPDPARSRAKASEGARISDRRGPGDRDHQDQDHCSHCGSREHTDLDCWKRLTCE
ncbi:LOW QUALITY PROTEIN: hypothetical protein PHMEG_00041839, partial [Phytophthora megakarya]